MAKLTKFDVTVGLINSTTIDHAASVNADAVKTYSGYTATAVTLTKHSLTVMVSDPVHGGNPSTFLVVDLTTGVDVYGRARSAGLAAVDITILKNIVM